MKKHGIPHAFELGFGKENLYKNNNVYIENISLECCHKACGEQQNTSTSPTDGTASAGTSSAGSLKDLVGIPQPWPLAEAPEGWLKCNGQAFDATKYPQLAKLYPAGTLPDLRGEFIRGWDDEGNIDTGRELLSKQHATNLRTAMLDYNGSDLNETKVYIGMAYSDADSVKATFSPNEIAYAPNGTDIGKNNAVDNGVYATSNYIIFNSNKPNWISVRPRNVAFNYIVKAG
ncbi:phage tail protein [Dickeya dadantii]|uniref:phage tail protein n=1 Tax=Dickeya dadantii TaxID=204038 RepID=UPI0014955829|nr:phage tail protein [Dickeya dadantii]MCL6405120.1 tail fiber protein [Dickeya dadantii]NPE52638.1 tail fiber protein [Dickeya dadantii]